MVTPSLDDPRCETLLLRLHAVMDVPAFWDALQSLLSELVPKDACIVYLDYLDFARTWSGLQVMTSSEVPDAHEWLQCGCDAKILPAMMDVPDARRDPFAGVARSARDSYRTDFFRKHMSIEGWCRTDASAPCRGSDSASGMAVRRTTRHKERASKEMAVLTRLHPHITTAMYRVFTQARFGDLRWSCAAGALEPESSVLLELSDAERELVQLVRRGWSNKEIAAELQKSIRTVKTQLTSVYKKLGVRSRARLLAMLAQLDITYVKPVSHAAGAAID